MSAATDTTSKLVEVPMVVALPPNKVANPMGMSTDEAGFPVRKETLIRIGRNRTTTGTLLIKALINALTTSVSSKETVGLAFHKRAMTLPAGSSAPVRTIPLAGDHQGADGHQRFMAEAAEKIHSMNGPICSLVRK